jgi:hypothetical protein
MGWLHHLGHTFFLYVTRDKFKSCDLSDKRCTVLLDLQGHDAVGRPLLERALMIQETALGPDHPDVIAIRDVLNTE